MKVLALDYGSARTGVAVSDPTGTLARPVGVIERAGSEAGIERLVELIVSEGAERVIVGIPLTLRGERGEQARASVLRKHRTGYVIADTAGKWTLREEVTAPFVYVRLHGSRVLYGSPYSEAELRAWAARVRAWLSGGRDVYAYFDNDRHAYAPQDALALARILEEA